MNSLRNLASECFPRRTSHSMVSCGTMGLAVTAGIPELALMRKSKLLGLFIVMPFTYFVAWIIGDVVAMVAWKKGGPNVKGSLPLSEQKKGLHVELREIDRSVAERCLGSSRTRIGSIRF